MGSLLLTFCVLFFFFNDTATTEIYTLSLHDALPIYGHEKRMAILPADCWKRKNTKDRKSTRLNSSHRCISYAVFCLKKKIYIHHRCWNHELREAVGRCPACSRLF